MIGEMITVDTNHWETSLYDGLKAYTAHASTEHSASFDVEGRRLDIGDIELRAHRVANPVGTATTVVYIERKTWADFASSICDGRYTEQKQRFLSTAMPSHRLVYLIESSKVHAFDGNVSGTRLSNKAVHAAIVKTQLRDNIPVLYTRSVQDAVHLIVYLHAQLCDGKLAPSANVANPFAVGRVRCAKRKRANMDDIDRCTVAMLTAIPGLSDRKAIALITRARQTMPRGNTSSTMAAIGRLSEDEIAQVQCGKMRLGKCLATRLLKTIGA